MNRLNLLILTIFTVQLIGKPAFTQINPISFECVLIGEVIERPGSKELLLYKENEDIRISSVSIPIENGKFSHAFTASEHEIYYLAFKDEVQNGTWRPMEFFVEKDTIYFRLHPKERFFENELHGGPLNQQLLAHDNIREALFGLQKIEKQQEALFADNRYLTAEAQALIDAQKTTNQKAVRDSLQKVFTRLESEDRILTAEARALRNSYRQQVEAQLQWQTEQIQTSPSLIHYREMLSLIRMAATSHEDEDPIPIAVSDLLSSFENTYAHYYPGHPYTKQMRIHMESMNTIKIGGRYIDFTAPDFDGKPVSLSEHIQGKVAFINLWASWCGPCRKKGIEMIPVYQAFRNNGFEVIGIARERDATAAVQAAQKDQYPWINLLEIDDNQQIWQRYGLGNSGGGTFLVDENGVIIAISPTAEEVQKILEERIGK